MLNKLRIFSKGKFATILVAIIIVPFVFWGMGSVFRGGNINSVAKINSFNISTKDFVDHINKSNLNSEIIKENKEILTAIEANVETKKDELGRNTIEAQKESRVKIEKSMEKIYQTLKKAEQLKNIKT